jgi:uncharacterized protein (TIGR03067 family)
MASVAFILFGMAANPSFAQEPPTAVDNELERIDGHWRVIEMVENGLAIPQDQMRRWLPGGGVMEIVGYTILFSSPVDGKKSTKSFRMDPTSYPKQIAIMDRDNVTGTGIYKFDQGKIVICITNEADQVPTEFSASKGSKRTLIVLERFHPGTATIPGMNAKLPEREPIEIPMLPKPEPVPAQAVSSRIPTQPAAAQVAVPQPPVPQPPVQQQPVQQQPVQQQPVPPVIITDSVAGRVLTDAEVRKMMIGTWRINDPEGSVDLVFDANGTFQSYRYFETMANFHRVFVPTPISTGTWVISGGRLLAKVTSSTRLDRVNQSFVPAVRSISATDMILVDHLGRVSRAVRTL